MSAWPPSRITIKTIVFASFLFWGARCKNDRFSKAFWRADASLDAATDSYENHRFCVVSVLGRPLQKRQVFKGVLEGGCQPGRRQGLL